MIFSQYGSLLCIKLVYLCILLKCLILIFLFKLFEFHGEPLKEFWFGIRVGCPTIPGVVLTKHLLSCTTHFCIKVFSTLTVTQMSVNPLGLFTVLKILCVLQYQIDKL